MSETSFKGEVALTHALLRCAEKRLIASRPIGDFSRYDLLIDDGGKIHRVQVKYANGTPSKSRGAVTVRLASANRARKKWLTYSDSEVDAILVFLPLTGKLYWLPPHVWSGRHAISIRVAEARNKQKKNCVMACDYEW